MSAVEMFRSLFEQASAQGSRSTTLAPIGWALATVLAALAGTAGLGNAPSWLPVVLTVFAACILLLYVAAYIYFMLKSPDNLRSEKFTLSKMALEKSVKGDNVGGFEKLDAKPVHPVIVADGPLALEGD